MIFITGATGLLGSYICKELLHKGYPVRAIKRTTSSTTLPGDMADKIHWVTGDMDDVTTLAEALEGVEAVIHGAAIISFDRRDEKRMYKTNVRGTADLVNACLKSGVKNFVHISSVAAIGRKRDQAILRETDLWEGTEYDSIYAKSKHHQELEVWRGAQEGLNVKIVNPSVVLGPGLWGQGSTHVFQYAYDEKTFHPEGTINYVDVRDVAEIIVRLMASDIKDERFILSAGSMDFKDFFGLIAKAFGKRAPRKPVPYWLLRVAVALEFVRSRITGKAALITKETARISAKKHHFKNDKIKAALDFEFRPVQESIDWSVKGLKARNNL